MRLQPLDSILNGLLLFLLGLCSGMAIVGSSISITNTTGMVLSATALFGVASWKRQIDYKERKDDQKNITKAIKLFDSYITEAAKEIWHPIENISELNYEKINTAIIKNQIKLRDAHRSISRSIELQSEIESEVATNSILKRSKKMQEEIQNLLIKSSILLDTLESSRLKLSDCLEESLILPAIFKKESESLNKVYKSYFQQYTKVEKVLGIYHSTEIKLSTAKSLGLID